MVMLPGLSCLTCIVDLPDTFRYFFVLLRSCTVVEVGSCACDHQGMDNVECAEIWTGPKQGIVASRQI